MASRTAATQRASRGGWTALWNPWKDTIPCLRNPWWKPSLPIWIGSEDKSRLQTIEPSSCSNQRDDLSNRLTFPTIMNHALDLKVLPVTGRADTRVLKLAGEFDASAVERALEEVTTLLDAGVRHLVVDCEDLRYVNSTGLGVILHFSRVARERGGSFLLCNVD